MSIVAWARPCLAVLAWSVACTPAYAASPELSIRYQLVTRFAGAETANGRIVVTVTNLSPRPIADLTLRLADASRGRITGKVQENLELAAGESRTLEGEFVLNVEALTPERPLDWLVVYSDPEGFAHQALVRSDVPPRATMDADASETRAGP